MDPIDYIIITIGVLIICGVIAFLIYQKAKGKKVGCNCGCNGCNGCPSAGACGGACPSKKETPSAEEQGEKNEETV